MTKILCVLLLTMILTLVACDIVCLQTKIEDCRAILLKQMREKFICVEYNQLLECMRSAATECNVESDLMVEDIFSIYNFTCTEDTEMNTLYKKHKDCIVGKKSTSGTRDCLKPFSDATISPIGISARSLAKKSLRLECKYRHKLSECFESNIKSTCGEEAMIFLQRLDSPKRTLFERTCEEFGYNNANMINITETLILALTIINLYKLLL